MIGCPNCGANDCILAGRRGGVEEWECSRCGYVFTLTDEPPWRSEHPGAWS